MEIFRQISMMGFLYKIQIIFEYSHKFEAKKKETNMTDIHFVVEGPGAEKGAGDLADSIRNRFGHETPV